MGFIRRRQLSAEDIRNNINEDPGEKDLQRQINEIDAEGIDNLNTELQNEISTRIDNDLELTSSIVEKTESLRTELENLNKNLSNVDQDILSKFETQKEYTLSLLEKITSLNTQLESEVIERVNTDLNIKDNITHQLDHLNYKVNHITDGLIQFYKTLSTDPRSKPYADHLLTFIKSNESIKFQNHSHNHIHKNPNIHYHTHKNPHTHHHTHKNKHINSDDSDIENDENESNDNSSIDHKLPLHQPFHNHYNNHGDYKNYHDYQSIKSKSNSKNKKISYKFDETVPIAIKKSPYHRFKYSHDHEYYYPYNHHLNRSVNIYSDKLFVNNDHLIDQNNYADFYRAINSSTDKYKYNKLLH